MLVLTDEKTIPEAPGLLVESREWLQKQRMDTYKVLPFQQLDRLYFFLPCKSDSEDHRDLEKIRKAAASVLGTALERKYKDICIFNHGDIDRWSLAAAEGLALANYSFDKYLKKKKEPLKKIQIVDKNIRKDQVDELCGLIKAVFFSRDLVNEPQNFLTATQLSKEIKKSGKENGFKVTVFGKKKLEEMKMGGILSVNQGSVEPPTFNILEWKPKNARNKKPIVLVGKGVVYDTGGLSLKPTANSMDMMKCDMAGSAAVIGTLQAVAANDLPVHCIALVPASDNRPGLNAYAPGDIITMYDGTTVEVLNTDAEGRLLLADALAYAKKYKPEIVLEASTLTGASVRAIGEIATAAMATEEAKKSLPLLESAGEKTFERIVTFPLWEEYGEEIKSKIADLKNLGGPLAGQIHAGKFLEHFTNYPFIHCDIAGPAFISSDKAYLKAGGTGVGVRLFYNFIKDYISK